MSIRMIMAVVSVAVVSSLASAAHASVMQSSGSNYIAFEAEIAQTGDNDPTDDRQWQVIADSQASGGQALQAMPGGTSSVNSSAGEQTAGYKLSFNSQGTYHLYIRHRTLPDANPSAANSAFAPTDFGSPPPGWRKFDNNGDNADYEYREDGSYSVSSGQLGQPLDFLVSIREDGYVIDRIILSQQTGLSASALDNLANSPVPEPSSLALAAVGLPLLLGRRRRGA